MHAGKNLEAEIEMVMAEKEEATFIAELLAAANKPGLPNRAVALVDLGLVVETLGDGEGIDLISDFPRGGGGAPESGKGLCDGQQLYFGDKARHVLARNTYCASSKACMRAAIWADVPESGRRRFLSSRLSSAFLYSK